MRRMTWRAISARPYFGEYEGLLKDSKKTQSFHNAVGFARASYERAKKRGSESYGTQSKSQQATAAKAAIAAADAEVEREWAEKQASFALPGAPLNRNTSGGASGGSGYHSKNGGRAWLILLATFSNALHTLVS
jgi:hypothetical protein